MAKKKADKNVTLKDLLVLKDDIIKTNARIDRLRDALCSKSTTINAKTVRNI